MIKLFSLRKEYTMDKLPVIIVTILSFMIAPITIPAHPIGETPEEQREWEEKLDVQNIRHTVGVRTDCSEQFITIPENYPEILGFDVAKTPPTIDFAIVQGLKPLHLPKGGERGGIWGGWNDVTRGPQGIFYFSIGNHMSYGANALIIRYDPITKLQKVVVESKEVMMWLLSMLI